MKYKQTKYIIPFLMGFFLLLQSCGTVKSDNPLIGKTTFDTWKNSQYWNESEYVHYDPNTQAVELFRKIYKEEKFKIVIFGSIYCDDCLKNIPQLARITESLRIPPENLLFYGLDQYNSEPSGFYKKYKFDNTPAVFLEFPNGERIQVFKGPDWLESMNYIISKRSVQRSLNYEK